jgi:hypothetical protein
LGVIKETPDFKISRSNSDATGGVRNRKRFAIMSWLIDEDSLDRFVSGNAGRGEVSAVEDALDIHEANEQFPSGGAVTYPPNFVRLYSTEPLNASSIMIDDDEDSLQSGVTILPSCSSSSIVSHFRYQRVQSNTLNPNMDASEVNMEESAAILSINPNSIDSSLLTEFSNCPMISSVVSDERSGSPSDSLTDMEVVTLDDRSVDSGPSRAQESLFSEAVASEYSTCPDGNTKNEIQRNVWYDRFETELDWEEFRDKTNQLLDAVDCAPEDRDEMIARLINMEERMLWESNRDAGDVMESPSKVSWFLEVAALTASVAVAGVVIIRLLRGR